MYDGRMKKVLGVKCCQSIIFLYYHDLSQIRAQEYVLVMNYNKSRVVNVFKKIYYKCKLVHIKPILLFVFQHYCK